MPEKIHAALVRQADKLELKGARRDAYIYGTLSKIEKSGKSKKSGKK